jgi:hypothetical protein
MVTRRRPSIQHPFNPLISHNNMSLKSDTKTYHLSCHCQTHVVALDLTTDKPFPENGVCNCSHCFKRRIVFATAPEGSARIVKGFGKDGADELGVYKFGTMQYGQYVSDSRDTRGGEGELRDQTRGSFPLNGSTAD